MRRNVISICARLNVLLTLTSVLMLLGVMQAQPKGAPFFPTVSYPSGGYFAVGLAAGDLNGDGHVDLAVINFCGGDSTCTSPEDSTVGVLMGHGDGTFASAVVYDLTGLSVGGLGPVAIADVNGDGKADLVVAGDCIAGQCPHGAVGVLLGNGDGTFRPVVISDAGAGFGAEGVAVVDLNGDGKLDVVVGECGTTDCFASEGLVGVLLGNGDGTFQPASTYDSGGALADSVAVADLNGDGKLDVVVGNVVGESVGVLLGNGDGTLRAAQTYRSGGNLTYTVVLGDLNGDGRPDLMVSSCAVGSSCGGTIKGAVGIWLGVGDGTFESGTTRRDSGTETLSIATADLDRDGILDLAATNSYATETLDTFLGNGDGTLRRGVILGCNGECVAVAAADVNGDGQPDLLVADSQPCYACDNSGSVGVILKKPGDSSLDTRDIHKQK